MIELVVGAALRSRTCAGSSGTTAATATAATLTVRAYSSLRGCAFLGLIGCCVDSIDTLILTVEVLVIVEVFSAVENDGVLVGGFGRALDWSGTLRTGSALAAITITAATISAVATIRTFAAIRTLAALASAGLLGNWWEA
jgi:hypothetical protein